MLCYALVFHRSVAPRRNRPRPPVGQNTSDHIHQVSQSIIIFFFLKVPGVFFSFLLKDPKPSLKVLGCFHHSAIRKVLWLYVQQHLETLGQLGLTSAKDHRIKISNSPKRSSPTMWAAALPNNKQNKNASITELISFLALQQVSIFFFFFFGLFWLLVSAIQEGALHDQARGWGEGLGDAIEDTSLLVDNSTATADTQMAPSCRDKGWPKYETSVVNPERHSHARSPLQFISDSALGRRDSWRGKTLETSHPLRMCEGKNF